jgi:AcrR family transcriptional regulator
VDEPRPIVYEDLPPERGALRDAMIELVAEADIASLTVEAIADRAGVGVEEFKRHFDDVQGICAQVYQEEMDEYDRVLFGTYREHDNWREGMRAAAYAAARFFAYRPQAAKFDLLEMFATGELPKAQRDAYLQKVIDLVHEGRSEMEDPEEVPRSVAENIVGSVVAVLYREMREQGNVTEVDRYVPALMYMLVRPYLGEEAALEELEIPPPPRQRRGSA